MMLAKRTGAASETTYRSSVRDEQVTNDQDQAGGHNVG
jgi:hypothetical protein